MISEPILLAINAALLVIVGFMSREYFKRIEKLLSRNEDMLATLHRHENKLNDHNRRIIYLEKRVEVED